MFLDIVTLHCAQQQQPISSDVGLASARSTPTLATETGSPVQQLSRHHGSRVRNAIPSKLKGKTDAKKGNFGVMVIDFDTQTAAAERGAAAKRTSESTALRAKIAFQHCYVPLSQRKLRHDCPAPAGPPPGPTAPPVPGGGYTAVPPTALPEPGGTQLTPTEIKTEQARLLTLLRSLHPVMVVDQICKALAFFGGIPGAPCPPSDLGFPQSHVANGSGSLFVGWLSEIFPPLESMPSATQRRPKGRPKGSKTTRFRRDKGPGKSIKALGSRRTKRYPFSSAGNPDDIWVDVDETAGAGEDIAENESVVVPLDPRPQVLAPSLHTSTQGAANLPTPRRRGRPKGSKNRPKVSAISNPATFVSQETTNLAASAPAEDHRIEHQKLVSSIKRAGPGRPKGSRNRPKHTDSSNVCSATKSTEHDSAHQLESSIGLVSLHDDRQRPTEALVRDGSFAANAFKPPSLVGHDAPIQTPPKPLKRGRTGSSQDVGNLAEFGDNLTIAEQSMCPDDTPVMQESPHSQLAGLPPQNTDGPNRKRYRHSRITQDQPDSKIHGFATSYGHSVDVQLPSRPDRNQYHASKSHRHIQHTLGLNKDLGDEETLSPARNRLGAALGHARPLSQSPVRAQQHRSAIPQEHHTDRPDLPQSIRPWSYHLGRVTQNLQRDLQVDNTELNNASALAQQHSQHRKHVRQSSTSPGQLNTAINVAKPPTLRNHIPQDGGAYVAVASTTPKSRPLRSNRPITFKLETVRNTCRMLEIQVV
ncbi:hypothetical protein BN1723_012642 [Verticillium longisporum]|uniref:Uncharacterized protein n=1 Tax=Verticillium longisporum TaxID=100787 RepID=A0A0G4LK54_VERLO|nr:hypothetical protein BN1723_012642 [Verticillium longisporum]